MSHTKRHQGLQLVPNRATRSILHIIRSLIASSPLLQEVDTYSENLSGFACAEKRIIIERRKGPRLNRRILRGHLGDMWSYQINRLKSFRSDGRLGRWDGWLRLTSSLRSLLRSFGFLGVLQALLVQFRQGGHAAPEARLDCEKQEVIGRALRGSPQ
jgi:hypothetical protein